MAAIRGLGACPVEEIRLAFVEAFSDYEVRVEMGPEKFAEFLRARSLDLSRSLGAFGDSGELQGFLLVGFREEGGRRLYYDGGTGILPGHRGRGLGDELLRALLGRMAGDRIEAFLLEVLEHNLPAQALYEKHGFRRTRRLRCYRAPRASLAPGSAGGLREALLGEAEEAALPGRLSLSPPSWQNEAVSIALARESHACLGLFEGGELAAYGYVHRLSGSVPQLGLAPERREAGSLALLLASLGRLTESPSLTLLNVEDGSPLCGLLEELGFENFVNQYEMAYRAPGP